MTHENQSNEKTKKLVFMEGGEDEDGEYQRLVEEGQIEEATVKVPKGYLSVSQVSMFLRCARSYEIRYVKGIIRPPKARMTEGSAIHKALEVAHKHRKTSKQPAHLDMLLDTYSKYWQEKKAEVEFEDESETDIMKRDETFLRLYHRDFIPKIVPEAVEMRFWVPMTEFRVPVMGYIDLVDSGEEDGMHTIVDHKVVDRRKTKAMADGDMQLTLYTHVTGLPKARYDMFVKNKTPILDTLRTVRTAKDIKWVEQIFAGVASAISKGVFPPCDPTSWMCNSEQCGYWSECRGR